MTEAEWLNSTDPLRMVRSLQGRGGSRRPRLWTCAFFRWYRSDVGLLMKAIRVAEVWADGEEPISLGNLSGFFVTDRLAWRAAERTAMFVKSWEESTQKQDAVAYHIKTLLCIFGNPFHPIAINPAWLTWNDGTVKKIAQSIYDERSFDRMPVLADALEEAGCHHDDILAHCRQSGEHVGGCWVVDLLLGKE